MLALGPPGVGQVLRHQPRRRIPKSSKTRPGWLLSLFHDGAAPAARSGSVSEAGLGGGGGEGRLGDDVGAMGEDGLR